MTVNTEAYQKLVQDGDYSAARDLLPPVNVPLLRKAVEWVEEQAALPHNGAWNQTQWVLNLLDSEAALRGCGTAYCLAGYVAQARYPELAHTSHAEINGEWLSSDSVALQELGITSEMYDLTALSFGCGLFYADNTAAQIREIAEWMAGEPL